MDNFGSGPSTIIRNDSTGVEKIRKLKSLLENQSEYFMNLKLKELEKYPNTDFALDAKFKLDLFDAKNPHKLRKG